MYYYYLSYFFQSLSILYFVLQVVFTISKAFPTSMLEKMHSVFSCVCKCVGLCECGWISSVMAKNTLPFEQTESLPISRMQLCYSGKARYKRWIQFNSRSTAPKDEELTSKKVYSIAQTNKTLTQQRIVFFNGTYSFILFCEWLH